MALQILERVVNTETDRRLVLFNAQLVRQMAIGSSWTTLRVAVRWALQGVDNIAAPLIYVGICSGTAHAYASDYCQHMVGCQIGSLASTATYSGTAPETFSINASSVPSKRIGHTTSALSASTILSNPVRIAGNAESRNSGFVMQFRKGGGTTWYLQTCSPASQALTSNKTYDQLRDALTLPTMSNVATYLAYAASSEIQNTSLAVDEGANGALNALCVFWNNPNIGLEISDLIAAKIN